MQCDEFLHVYIQIKVRNVSSSHRLSSFPFPLSTSLKAMYWVGSQKHHYYEIFHHPLAFLVLDIYINRVRQCVLFWAWVFFSLNIATDYWALLFHISVTCSLLDPTICLFIRLLMGTWMVPSLGHHCSPALDILVHVFFGHTLISLGHT